VKKFPVSVVKMKEEEDKVAVEILEVKRNILALMNP
jgi:uncharacterized protein YbcI